MISFRSGTVVKFEHDGCPRYGVIVRLKRKHYSVLVLVGGGVHNGGKWTVPTYHLQRVSGKMRDEVLRAQAVFALTGKVPS